MKEQRLVLIFVLATLATCAAASALAGMAPPVTESGDEITLREALVIRGQGRSGRVAFQPDAVQALVVDGRWKPPAAGDELTDSGPPGRVWEAIRAADDGTFQHDALRGGYAYIAVPVESDCVMILEAAGHGMVYVNGEPRTGDPYSHGYVHLPVLLRTGVNHLLFQVPRGSLRAKLAPFRASCQLDSADLTLSDAIVGEPVDTWGAIVVVNATVAPVKSLHIEAKIGAGTVVRTPVPVLPPLSTRKVGFRLAGSAPVASGELPIRLDLLHADPEAPRSMDSATFKLGVRQPHETHKRTFRSEIDGSVQYFSLVPASKVDQSLVPGDPHGQRPGLVLTLHGAGVEAAGQAACFTPKPGIHVVAPTNRRPFGFDWEDWGRLDAIEVMEFMRREFDTDPHRTYLTGHSMGGHGTWHLGVTFPDRFAAIGPSAGWVSMWSYAGARRAENPDRMQEMLVRAAMPSDTLALSRNFAQHGVYVLHGDQDDNVPVDQARTMRRRLAEFHSDFAYYEQRGAGHWWGNPCVDWPPMFEFFARHTVPEWSQVRRIEFATASPGVSPRSQWVSIEAQAEQLKLSSVDISQDPEKRRFAGKTQNVSRLAIHLSHLKPDEPIEVELDGQKLEGMAWPVADVAGAPTIWLLREGEKWSQCGQPAPLLKGPHRYGTFKDAFRHHVVLVYGTRGSPDENAWALAKARFDAETFWYRGNGSMELVPDSEFDPNQDRDCNVIIYGNAETNSVWPSLLAESPVQVRRSKIEFGDRVERGEQFGCLFVRPRPQSDRAVVGVVGGTGLAGMRLTDRLPYFISGVAYPDCVMFGPEILTEGVPGVRIAGFFGIDWSIANGEFVSAGRDESSLPTSFR